MKKYHCVLFLEVIALSCGSEVLFQAFFVGLVFGCRPIHFHAGLCCCTRKCRLAVDLITCT